jgi:PIN domain nuclease of toxin-antitoxin system
VVGRDRVTRLDTHVVAWLYAGEVERLSPTARELLERGELVISPMVQLELIYLHEAGRLSARGGDVVADLRERVGLHLSDQPFSAVVAAAADLTWTRDPFDRLIVGDAVAANSPLITKDETILSHCGLARWNATPEPRHRRLR